MIILTVVLLMILSFILGGVYGWHCYHEKECDHTVLYIEAVLKYCTPETKKDFANSSSRMIQDLRGKRYGKGDKVTDT